MHIKKQQNNVILFIDMNIDNPLLVFFLIFKKLKHVSVVDVNHKTISEKPPHAL